VTAQEAETKFTRMYEAHHKQVLAYCLRRSPSDGWDAAADTFAVAWKRIDIAPEGEGSLPWLYTVARKVLANTYRKNETAARLNLRLGRLAGPATVGPDVQVVQRWEEKQLIEAFRRLRPDDSEVLRLATWEELPHDQIAEILGISVSAVGQRIHRATKRLGRQLKGSMKTEATTNPNPHAAEEGRTA